jgi:hypothetical protein
MRFELKPDPEIENGPIAKSLKWVWASFAAAGFFLYFFVIQFRPHFPDPVRGFVVPIPNQGSNIYITKAEYFLSVFFSVGFIGSFFGSFVLLAWIQRERNRARKEKSIEDPSPEP